MGDDFTDTSFVNESLAYFKRNYGDKGIVDSPPSRHLVAAVQRAGIQLDGATVLEVGCGGGANLHWLNQTYDCRCTGIETNPQVVRELAKARPALHFNTATADRIPYDTASFDLVLLSGVLCWIDRNYILQALGESLRVSRRWIVVTDFCPSSPRKVPYKHRPDMFTWKIDYEQLLLDTGVLELLYSQLAESGRQGDPDGLVEIDAQKHRSGQYDWGCFRTSIYLKNIDLIPTCTDFSDNTQTEAEVK